MSRGEVGEGCELGLQVERLADRAIAGGWTLMLLASAILVGSFLLTSVYLQEVLGASPLETGLGFLPIAVAAGAGAQIGSQMVRRVGVRTVMAAAFAVAGVGTLLLSRIGGTGRYAGDILPGLLLALVLLPAAGRFLPRLRESHPPIALH